MEREFTAEEIRVLGVLVEKQMTTPEYYPLTPNAIKNACNQKSNREPVVQYDDDIIADAIASLRKKQMVIVVTGAGSRVRKYEHRLKETFFLSQKELAILSELMLRGPRTIGELRGRGERMVEFEGLEEVEEILKDLAAEDRDPQSLVVKLPVLPGQKEHRFLHLLAGEPDLEALNAKAVGEHSGPLPESGKSRIGELEEKIEALSREMQDLREQFEAFRRQFE